MSDGCVLCVACDVANEIMSMLFLPSTPDWRLLDGTKGIDYYYFVARKRNWKRGTPNGYAVLRQWLSPALPAPDITVFNKKKDAVAFMAQLSQEHWDEPEEVMDARLDLLDVAIKNFNQAKEPHHG